MIPPVTYESPVGLGEPFTDIVTGWSGTAVQISFRLYSVPLVLLERAGKDGVIQQQWFDAPRLRESEQQGDGAYA